MLTLRVQWGYGADVVRFFGPVGRSNAQDLAKDLNRDLVQERFEEYQVCDQNLLLLRPTAFAHAIERELINVDFQADNLCCSQLGRLSC